MKLINTSHLIGRKTSALFILLLTASVAVEISAAPPAWLGMDESDSVAKSAEKRYQTPQLPVGRYVFNLTGSGDADLYVRAGTAPTTSAYDCRPYKSGSVEQCELNLSAPAIVHVMVRGYATSSTFRLVGKKESRTHRRAPIVQFEVS